VLGVKPTKIDTLVYIYIYIHIYIERESERTMHTPFLVGNDAWWVKEGERVLIQVNRLEFVTLLDARRRTRVPRDCRAVGLTRAIHRRFIIQRGHEHTRTGN